MKWSPSVCIRSSSHTPVWLARRLQETSQKEGTDWSSIHQLSLESSVWARCGAEERHGAPRAYLSALISLSVAGAHLLPPASKVFPASTAEKARQTDRQRFLNFKEKRKAKRSRSEVFHQLPCESSLLRLSGPSSLKLKFQ